MSSPTKEGSDKVINKPTKITVGYQGDDHFVIDEKQIKADFGTSGQLSLLQAFACE